MLTVLFNLTQLTCTNKITSIREKVISIDAREGTREGARKGNRDGAREGTRHNYRVKAGCPCRLAAIFLTAIKVHLTNIKTCSQMS